MSTYILKDNQQTGPYEDADIRSALASGGLTYADYAWREGMAEWQTLDTLYPPPPPPPPPRPAPQPRMQSNAVINSTPAKPTLTCQTCGQGTLTKRKKYRMSLPVVVIGYIFLIPSVIGMLFGLIGLFATGSAATQATTSIEQEARNRLKKQAIPEQIIAKIVADKPLAASDLSPLTQRQRAVVQDVKMSVSAGRFGAGAGTAVVGGLSFGMIIMSFVGGLIGWLLVMKKLVLQCKTCGAVVAAS